MRVLEHLRPRSLLDEGLLEEVMSDERLEELEYGESGPGFNPTRWDVYRDKITDMEEFTASTQVKKSFADTGDLLGTDFIPGYWTIKAGDYNWDGEELDATIEIGLFDTETYEYTKNMENPDVAWGYIKNSLSVRPIGIPPIEKLEGVLREGSEEKYQIRMEGALLNQMPIAKRKYIVEVNEE